MKEWNDLFKEMRERPEHWHETSQAMFDEMLGAVPPADIGGGAFLMGEPVKHVNGEPVYYCSREIAGEYLARYMTQAEFQQFKSIRS